MFVTPTNYRERREKGERGEGEREIGAKFFGIRLQERCLSLFLLLFFFLLPLR